MSRSLVGRRAVLLTLVPGAAGAIALVLATVGPPAEAGGRSDVRTLRVRAVENGGLSFSRERLRTRPGRVRLVMSNPSSNELPHAIAIERGRTERQGRTVQPGRQTSRVSIRVRRGTYTFYCPVGQHRQNGMEGTLRVR
jgi:plastocyanin